MRNFHVWIQSYLIYTEWMNSYTEAKQSSYSKLCILVPNNIIYFGLLFLIGNQTIVKL